MQQTLPSTPAGWFNAERVAGASVGAALLASTAMSGFGVGSGFWDGLTHGEPAAYVGLAIFGAALAASEVGAVAVAMAITRDGVTVARSALFGLCTIANVLAGHYGADAINTRLVAPQRLPFTQALERANAAVRANGEDLRGFQTQTADDSAQIERAIADRAHANPAAISANARADRADRAALAARQQAERTRLANKRERDNQALADAQAAMATAPKGFEQFQLWALSFLLECLKGVLVWVAAPRRRKISGGASLPIDKAAYTEMADDELEQILATGRRASAFAQQERTRRANRPANVVSIATGRRGRK